MPNTQIPVPQPVLDGIEAARRSGRTNMLDRPAVERLADALGFHATVLWLHDNPGDYARGIFHGFRAELDAGDEPDLDTRPEPDDQPDPGAPDA